MLNVPVFARELLAAARQPFTHHLRLLGAGTVLGVCTLFLARSDMGPQVGAQLFTALHTVLWLSIWFLVPLLSADCLSRERREGTLPLLFLTSLAPASLVLAKATVHGLRAFTLLLAVLPVMAIAFVAGGISWQEGLLSFLINFTSMLLALVAGVITSARARAWPRAVIAASCLGWLFCLAFLLAEGWIVASVYLLVARPANPWRPDGFWNNLALIWEVGVSWVTGGIEGRGGRAVWKSVMGTSPATGLAILWAAAGAAATAVLASWILVRLAGWSISRSWRDEPPPAWLRRLKEVLCTPVLLTHWLRRGLRWQLERNPIGWLQHRTWSARLVSWSWVGILAFIYSAVLTARGINTHGMDSWQVSLALLLGGSMAAAAAGSFRQERDAGVLELLLVSPVQEWRLISGRVRGLWEQFFLSLVLFFAVWVVFASIADDNDGARISRMLYCGVVFLTVPGIGLYYALSKPGFFGALAWALLAGVVLSGAIAHAGCLFPASRWGEAPTRHGWLEAGILVQAAMGALLYRRLHRKLSARQFANLGLA